MKFVAIVALATLGCASVQQDLRRASMDRLWAGAAPFCQSRAEFESHVQAALAVPLEARRPRVGWSACKALGYTALPDEQATVETASGTAAHWHYHETQFRKAGLVVVEPANASGVVTSVVW